MGEHPAADEEEGLDRATTQDDEAGGAGAWAETGRWHSHCYLSDYLGNRLIQRMAEANQETQARGLVERLLMPTLLRCLRSSARCPLIAVGPTPN